MRVQVCFISKYFPKRKPVNLRVILLLLIVIIPFIGSIYAQTIPSVNWIRQFGTTTADPCQGISARQNIYMTGYTAGAFSGQTFDGTYFDPWTLSFDHEGNMQWVDQFGTGGSEGGYAIVDDVSGVYTVGYITGIFPGEVPAGLQDIYIRKYDHNGVAIWTRQFGSEGYEMRPGAITVDATGVYTCGQTSGSMPGYAFAGGGEDLFIVKYSLDGDFLWCRQVGTDKTDNCNGVYADNTGLYICGSSAGSIYGLNNLGANDALVAKYTHDGDLVWAHTFGTLLNDIAYEICGDESGLYLSGSTLGAFPGQTHLGTGYDVFVTKFDFEGNQIWIREFGTTGIDYGYGISLNTSGVFVVGNTTGTFPGQIPAIGYDIFVSGFDKMGNQNWLMQFGSNQRPGTTAVPQDYGYSISVVSLTAYIAGYTNGIFPDVSGVGGTDGVIIELLVQTPPEATQDLTIEVAYLVEAGMLNQGQGNSLTVKLQHALNKMDQGNYNVAINLLNAFINEVTDLNITGVLPDKEAEDLIIAAGRIISELEKLLVKQGVVPQSQNPSDAAFKTWNYPNPFTSSTEIYYTLPDNLNVTLKVYDSRGTEVSSSEFGNQNAGTHNVSFNSDGLLNGLYYYRIEAGNYQVTKKLVIIK